MPRYDAIGATYAQTRREDPRIAARLSVALGDARTVVNVGAGTGSYEPADRHVIAIEPSPVMVAQRGPDRVPAILASARALLSGADLVMANLEGTYSRGGESKCGRASKNCFAFQAPPANAPALSWAGIDQIHSITFRPNLATADPEPGRGAAHVRATELARGFLSPDKPALLAG